MASGVQKSPRSGNAPLAPVFKERGKQMKAITVTVKGKSPLLMHRFPMEPIEALEKKLPEEQAEIAAYRDPDTGELYVPAINFHRALIAGAAYSKGKGRASLAKVAACAIFVSPERLSLGTKHYTIDARPVVVPATKGRVVRYRPRLDEWQFTCTLEYDETLLKESQVRKIVDDTLERVGLLDFRPERKGPFGRGMVVEWKPIE